jgi:hypothetical protein
MSGKEYCNLCMATGLTSLCHNERGKLPSQALEQSIRRMVNGDGGVMVFIRRSLPSTNHTCKVQKAYSPFSPL